MKIEATSPALTQLPSESAASRVPSVSTQSPAQDRTSFQSDITSVQSLANRALQSPEVRQAKVDALRQAVSSDQYKIDANRIASAITGVSGS